jgi:hypothetical protein
VLEDGAGDQETGGNAVIEKMNEIFEDIGAEVRVFEGWMRVLGDVISGVNKRLQAYKLGVKAQLKIDDVDGEPTWIAWARPSAGSDRTWQLCIASGEPLSVLTNDECWIPLHAAPLRARIAAVPRLEGLVEVCLARLQELNGELQTKLQRICDEAATMTGDTK